MADWSTCPSNPGPSRDAWMLAAVQNGEAEGQWAEISNEINGHTATFTVLADALKISGVRFNVSAALQQQIADVLGCLLLTPQLADMIFAARSWTVPPYTIAPVNGGIPDDTDTMISQSAKIDAALEAQGYDGTGIVQTVGKHWTLGGGLDTHPGMAENYGWHFLGGSSGYNPATSYAGSGVRVWQPASTMHNDAHTDYSQNCQLVARSCLVDGHDNFSLDDVLTNPDLAPLASRDGVLVNLRQPGVGELDYGGAELLPLPPRTQGGQPSGNGFFADVEKVVEESPLLTTALITGAVGMAREFGPDIARFVSRLFGGGRGRRRR